MFALRGVVVCAWALAAPLAAQQPRVLSRPDLEFAESFDAVFALRELPGGRLLVTDLGPQTVQLVDLAGGSLHPVGRKGQGPGEYQYPGALLPYQGDTTLLVDRVSRRFLTVTADGALGPTIPYPDAIRGLGDPRGADARGRIYFQGSALPGEGAPPPSQMPDSVPVLRWDRGSGRVDTVAVVKIPALKMQVSGSSNARAVMIRPQPYAPNDEWVVTPDGSILVARVGDYHVERLADGSATRGPPVRYAPVAVREGDKKEFLSRMQNSRNRIVVNRGGPGRGEEQRPPEPSIDEFQWPAVKPPFINGSALLAPDGGLWLARSTSVSDSTPVYDVFDGRGNLKTLVTLRLGRRVVGLGVGVVYAVRTDADGLQWLERYRF